MKRGNRRRIGAWVAWAAAAGLVMVLARHDALRQSRERAASAAAARAGGYFTALQQFQGAFGLEDYILGPYIRNGQPSDEEAFNHDRDQARALASALRDAAAGDSEREKQVQRLLVALAQSEAAFNAAVAARERNDPSAATLYARAEAVKNSVYSQLGQIYPSQDLALAKAGAELRAAEGASRWDEVAAGLALLALVLGALLWAASLGDARRSFERLRELATDVRAVPYRRAANGRVLERDPALARLLGLEPARLGEISLPDLCADAASRDFFAAAPAAGAPMRHVEVCLLRPDGVRVWALASAKLTRPGVVEGALLDITDHKSVEEQLRQAQKLEAIGQLAGGVAHDFNNLLTVICGGCELLLGNEKLAADARARIATMKTAAETAAGITRQLLIFSRRQPLEPCVLDAAALVGGRRDLLRALLGDQIELVIAAAPAPVWVRADATQLEQILVNLAVNARDAMPQGGRLRFEVAARRVLPQSDHPLPSGEYALMLVSDTGKGMDESTRAHIFEPFFTTKQLGTGLGLSTVHSIVEQFGGRIFANSQPGRGTTFEIYLPLAPAPAAAAASAPAVKSAAASL